MAFTKLFREIVTSSVWGYDSDTRIVWVTLLALADENGEVVGTAPGLSRLAVVPLAKVEEAIRMFSSPDLHSMSKNDDGRRVEVIDRGWRLINHAYYRRLGSREEKQEADRARIADKRRKETPMVSGVSQGVASASDRLRQVATGCDDRDSSASASASMSDLPPPDPKSRSDLGRDLDPEVGGRLWSAWDWLSKFKPIWCDRYGAVSYGNRGDAKAIADLGDLLGDLPAEERRAAQLRAGEMIAEFLAEDTPQVISARHPFTWFVSRFGGYRAGKLKEARVGKPRDGGLAAFVAANAKVPA